jgi:hypothetical protein
MALSAFNAYFAVKYFEQATFDAGTGVSHEVTEIRNQEGAAQTVDLWTGCYTPRELRLMLAVCEFEPHSISSVDPGGYQEGSATTESSEFLVIAFATPVRRMGTR